MALTDKQINELNIAQKRVEAAKAAGEDLSAYKTDIENLEYAKTKGYAPPTVEANSPAPAEITPSNSDYWDVNPNKKTAPETPAKPTNSNQPTNQNKPAAAGDLNETQKQATGIDELVASGRTFNETDARNYAYAQNEKNWQQYVGGVAGQPNPFYISPGNWSKLQKQYTPYQLQKGTIRTKDGIYWNSEINIIDIPRTDPADQINSDTSIISGIINDAKGKADITVSDKMKGIKDDGKKDDSGLVLTDDPSENKDEIMNMISNLYGTSAEDVYNDLFNTDEIKNSKADVIKYQNELDKYDQQLEELKDDIRKEVEGEASESKITAMAAIRGDKILKLKRSTQRDYDTALAEYNSLKEEAANLLQVRVSDNNTRYNRLFSMLQLQIQEEGTQWNKDMAMTQLGMQLPKGRSMTLPDGTVVNGVNETDNLNVLQFTEANGDTYVIGVDKTTGETKYKEYIGKTSVGGGGVTNNYQYQYKEFEAQSNLERAKEYSAKVESGEYGVSYDEKGKSFYYDKKKYDADLEKRKNDWIPFNEDISEEDYRI